MDSDPLRRALSAYERADWREAEQLCEEVLRRQPDEPTALLVLGNTCLRSGQTPRAQQILERARAVAPSNRHVLNSLGATYRANGLLNEARAAFETAIEIDSSFAPALNNLGNVLEDLNDRAGAKSAYERAAAQDPNYAEAIANLAGIAEKEHRLAEARELAGRALTLSPNLTTAVLTMARVDLREKKPEGAVSRLSASQKSAGWSLTNQAIAAGIMGQAHETLARYDEAFAHFERANQILKSMYAPRYANHRGATSIETIGRLTSFVDSSDIASWRWPVDAGRTEPVFLAGFPRSGTTLLEQILSSHPEIETLEEENNFADAMQPLIMAEGALERWPQLSFQEIETFRNAYWERVREAAGRRPARKIFIDKMPLNTVLLPLIYRLFPRAKIIFVLRDPRDVAISCFQQRFGMNAAMFQLLSIDSTVHYYDAVMRLGAISRARLPLDLHVVRYEDIVTNFEETVRSLISFLGLPWDDALRGYTKTARLRTINTPSAAQVVEPLYLSSIGKWRHYRTRLLPHAAALDSWATSFGYSVE